MPVMTVRLRIAVAILVAAVFVAACATKKTLPIVVGVGEPKAGEPKEAPVDGRGAAGGAPGGRCAGRGGRGGETAATESAGGSQHHNPRPLLRRRQRRLEKTSPSRQPRCRNSRRRPTGPSRPIARRAPAVGDSRFFYGTNRPVAPRAPGPQRSSGIRRRRAGRTRSTQARRRDVTKAAPSDLEVGRFKVTFPPGHQPGIIERPLTVLTIQLRAEAPSRDVVISELASSGTDYDAWVRAVKANRQARRVYLRARLLHQLRGRGPAGWPIGVRPGNRP
jgi:hypothetical protein